MSRLVKRFVFLSLGGHLSWVLLNGVHAYAAAGSDSHSCRQKGDVAHQCRHESADGKIYKDKDHDGRGHLHSVSKVRIALGQMQYAALLGFQDDVSIPPECTCMISCFLSGDGLPSPNYPNDDE